jgi:hypothetical protein
MLVSTTLQTSLSDNDLSDLELDDEFIVVPLDLISGIVQGLGHAVQPFVQKSSLLGLLAVCAHHVRNDNTLSFKVFIICFFY